MGAEAAVLARGAHFDTQGQRYWVSRFVLEYAEPHPAHPALDALAAHNYALGQADDGYVGPRRGGRNFWFRLDEMGQQQAVPVYASGLRELAEQIVGDLNARGLIGVYVAPNPDDIDPTTGEDKRAPAQTALRLRVYTGRVGAVRTFAADPELDNQERVDRPEHRVIAQRSPVGPQSSDLLDRKRLDEYVARLNRHQGRFVDVVLTPTLQPGRINVDYIVEEERPWSLYSSFSDTGTRDTDRWRQRFGFAHQQLTGLDDVLRVDYVTDGFDDIDAFFGSYDGLIPGTDGTWLDGMRWRFGAARSEYSSEVFFAGGAGGTDEIFAGETTQLEFGIAQNVYQSGGLFVDLGAGLRWLDVDLTNLTVYDAKAKFLIPGLTLQLEDTRAGSIRYAALTLEQASSSGFSEEDDDFGREDLDDSWLALRWNAGIRFEPWSGRRSGGGRSFVGRLHEIELSTEGQYAFDQRLIPQEQGVIGGLYTVRGYPQSLVAGDSIAIARAEYRYHIPLSLSQGSSFWSDWNLVLRSFVDMGWAINASGSVTGANGVPIRLADDGTEQLTSIGVGAEILIRRNLSLRLDYGIALQALEDEGVDSGDSEAHLAAIVRY
jgi:hemolysin activation/secretion protein